MVEADGWLCPCGAGHARQYRTNPVAVQEFLLLRKLTWRDLVEPSGLSEDRVREIVKRDWATRCEAERLVIGLGVTAETVFPSIDPAFANIDPVPENLGPPASSVRRASSSSPSERRVTSSPSNDLSPLEQRLALVALWDAKRDTEVALARTLEDDVRLQLIEVAEAYDAAARKMGGDPSQNLYGASRN